MLNDLEIKFRKLEHSRLQLLQTLAHHPEDQLEYRPSPHAWSILQVVHHLILTEQQMLQYMEKKLKGYSPANRLGIGARLRSVILAFVLKLPLKFKTPMQSVVPSPDLSLQELHSQWDRLRIQIDEFLDSISKDKRHYPIFRHPIAGRFTIVQALSFLQDHFDHHMRQIERIKKAGGIATQPRDVQ